jgi:hypothetical protein
MNVSQMLERVNARVDDVVPDTDGIPWLNDGKDELNILVEATIPDVTASSDVFDIPTRFHVGLVLYASARFKEQDGSPSEAQHFMNQWEEIKREFVQTYQVPPKYRDDRLAQNFVATEGQTDFTITKIGYVPQYNRLKLYVNDLPVSEDFEIVDRTFKFLTGRSEGDKVTAVWEEHADIVEPPYKWWKAW